MRAVAAMSVPMERAGKGKGRGGGIVAVVVNGRRYVASANAYVGVVVASPVRSFRLLSLFWFFFFFFLS